MRITTKKLTLISLDVQDEMYNKIWVLFSRNKRSDLGVEIARITFFENSENRANEISMEVDIINEEYFEIFGEQGITELLKRHIFRQKDIYFVKYTMKSESPIIALVMEKVGFVKIDGKNCWRIEKPISHYMLLFMMVGGMCGLSFGRNFEYPFLMVIVGFLLGFAIGFPLDKKDKVIRQ